MDPRMVPLPPSPRSSKKTFPLDPIVRLNVGGVRYEVSRDTLTRYKGSLLVSLARNDSDDELFLFRDGHLFAYVLDYLRSGRAHLPSLISRETLKEELDYFQIPVNMSQIFEEKDYHTMDRLNREIKEQKAAIQAKEMELAAIVESYRLAYKCSESISKDGYKIMAPSIKGGIDRKLLNECLLSRGLDAYGYQIEDRGARVLLGPTPEPGALNKPFRFSVRGCEATPFVAIPRSEPSVSTPEKEATPPVATGAKGRTVRVRRK